MKPSDPLGILSATRRFVASVAGSGQVLLGAVLLAGGLLLVASQTSAGRAALKGSGQLGRAALAAIPQTRILAAL